MAEDTGEVLRRSLDAVDRHRKRLVAGLVVALALLVLTFVVGAHAAYTEGNTAEAIFAHFVLLVVWVTALALVVVIHTTVMTKRILLAIELASKK